MKPLATIGYEASTHDAVIARLKAAGVELLVDVLNRSPADLHASGQRINLNIEDNAICEVA